MVMQKLGRQPARLDSLDLFRLLDTGSGGHVSDPERVEAFLAKVRGPLSEALSAESTVHGWRTQLLFGSLVVALDACVLLFTVDHGEMFADGDDVKPPDFLLVLRDGRRMLVDVKSVPPKRPTGPLRVSASEMDGLRRFADLLGGELFIAGLFTAMGEWVLVPAGAFELDERGRYAVDLLRAFQTSEMSALGDVMLGVVPPLRFDLVPAVSEPHQVGPDGTASFTIGAVELRVGGQLMVEEAERKLAMFLLRFSQWPSREDAEVDGSTLRRVSVVCEPEEPTHGQGFEIVGKLSSMYTRWFYAATSDPDGGVSALDTSVEPGVLPALLPADFSSPRLPLWRFTLIPQPAG
ncbi:MAG TPA: hypothetical protein VK988_23080 [Acidimicrobiales bacterium]|nr:hypothetical protein [Acidimicrobiales bacterium]